MLVKNIPNFMKEFMALYYKKIRENPEWRPNRDDVITLWEAVVPTLNGYPLRKYLDTLPAFQGRKLDPGMYILNEISPYGESGNQVIAISYALSGEYECSGNDGMLWWGICKSELSTIPEWVKTSHGEDDFYYVDMQGIPFTVKLVDASGKKYPTYHFKTVWDRDKDGSASGFGWFQAPKLALEKFPIGLYKETVTFTDYMKYDAGAREINYFFGLKDFKQDKEKEYVIMIGIDGVAEGRAQMTLDGKPYVAPIKNGVALFRSSEWKFDIQGVLPITITNTKSVSKTYERVLLESGTEENYFQQQFIIVDTNFNGVEDMFEE
jgi:hypothetical protein